jgi:predicted nucleic acid-binding protein
VALIILDASVLIAHLEPADAHHEAAVEALVAHAGDDLRLPASALAETLVVPARRGRLAEAREALTQLLLVIEPLTQSIAERAAELRGRHRTLRLPDALVLATGDIIGADKVLTADRRWARWSGRVQAIG